jgi:tRNA(adenine34) deaminase
MTTAAFEPVDIDTMQLAISEARAALEHDDVPVGAVGLRGGQIIAARHNERELTGDPTAHAELLALRDAAREVGHWRLNDCSLFVTLEPCSMCAGACVNARLGRLVYATPDPKAGACMSNFGIHDGHVLNHRIPTTTGPCADEAAELLRAFFRARR